MSAIESIANMQYLNLNHSKIAIGAYYGLSGSKGTNWIADFNNFDRKMLTFEYGIFARNGLSSLYLDNIGHSLTEIMAYLMLYLLFGAISLRRTKEELLNGRVGRIYVGILGLFISTIAGRFQSHILFVVIQILKIDLFVDIYPRISYVMAYFLFSVVIGLQLLCFFKVRAIFSIKVKVDKLDDSENSKIANDISAIPVNNFLSETTQPNPDERWKEMKYSMFFNSFKETCKHSFFFTYWMTAYNTVYIFLILALQNAPVFQCLSITVLVVICILTSITFKPFKEKSIAFIFFSNYTCILIAASINLTLAVQAAVYGATSFSDQAGSMIFWLILANSSINTIVLLGGVVYKLCSMINNCIKKKKMPATTAPQQIQIARSNNPSNELEERNPRMNLQLNYQSNLPQLRNDDVLFQEASRRSEVQGYTDKYSIRITDSARYKEERRQLGNPFFCKINTLSSKK